MTQPVLLGTISSHKAGLTVVLFDSTSCADWIPTRPAATKAMFTGHPAEVMRGLGKGDEVTPVDVGISSGYAFELEGKSGKLEVYRLDDETLALLAPPRAWWLEHHADHADEINLLFDEATNLEALDDADEIGPLELGSGKLAAIYLWHKKVGTGRALADTAVDGGAVEFDDGYGDGTAGLIIDAGAGEHRLVRREHASPWNDSLTLVTMYLARD